MNKFNLSFKLDLWLIALLIFIAIYFIRRWYQNTRPNIAPRPFYILVSLRSIIVILFIALISVPILKRWLPEHSLSEIHLLIDQSNSTAPYIAQVQEFIDTINNKSRQANIQINTRILNKGQDLTDFYSELTHLNRKGNTNPVILITDGNQTEDTELKLTETMPVTIFPIGAQAPVSELQIQKLDLPRYESAKELKQLPVSFIYKSETKGNLSIFINDYLVSNHTVITSERSQHIQVPFSFINGTHQIQILLKSETESTELRHSLIVNIQKPKLAYLYTSPDVNAKFFIHALQEDYHVEYIPVESLSKFETEPFKGFIVSYHENDKNATQLLPFIQGIQQPLILFPRAVNRIVFQDILNLKTEAPLTGNLKLHPNAPPAFKSFISSKFTQTLSDFPKLRFLPLHLESKSLINAQPLFLSGASDIIYLIEPEDQASRNLIINATDFWKFHLEMQNDYQFQQFYTELVRYLTNYLLNSRKHMIRTNLTKSLIVSERSIPLEIEIKFDNGNVVPHDELHIEIETDGKPLETIRLPFQPSGSYLRTIKIPQSGLLTVKSKTIVNNQLQFLKSETFPILNASPEQDLKYRNDLLLTYIATTSNGKLINKIAQVSEFFKPASHVRYIPDYLKLNQSEVLLYLLLSLICLEWWLRKHFQLM